MEDKTLIIQQPEFCKNLGDEVWQYLVHDLKNDNEFRKLCRRYYEVYTKLEVCKNSGNTQLIGKETRHLTEIMRQINVRRDQFAMYWIKKYGSAELTLKEVMSVLEGENLDKFRLRAATVMFLADWMEDCLLEMNSCIKTALPDAKYEPLKDFFVMQKKVSTYARQAIDTEGENYQELFDEHAACIKMTIYNKVNGFLNRNNERIEQERQKEIFDKRQLSFNFEPWESKEEQQQSSEEK